METPPSNIQARNTGYNPNYRLETPIINSTNNNEQEDFIRNEYLNKMNPSKKLKKMAVFLLFLLEMLKVQSPFNEKEIFQKKMAELRKRLIYVEESNWMFENNDGLNTTENLPNLI